jgi:hypothetical protein
MKVFSSLDWSLILDGLTFGIGIAMVWLGAVITASIVRSLSIAGGSGILLMTKLATGYWRYKRADASDIVNATLNTLRGGVLSIDTLVADRLVMEVWPNPYHMRQLWRAARACTEEQPVIVFAEGSIDDYNHTYDPIVSMIAASCSNEGSVDLALGKPVIEHRFVVALTYEKVKDRRMRHFRAMVILETEMSAFLEQPGPRLRRPEHATRLATLRCIARQYQAHPERFGLVSVWRPAAAGAAVALKDGRLVAAQ